MIRERSSLVKTAVVTGVAILVGLIATLSIDRFPFRPGGPPPDPLVFLIRVKLFVTTFNLVLLLALTGSYATVYRDLPNKYTRSLLALSILLVLYAITSNPLMPLLFGFPPRPALGPFTFLSDVFVGLAIIVLLYQSET